MRSSPRPGQGVGATSGVLAAHERARTDPRGRRGPGRDTPPPPQGHFRRGGWTRRARPSATGRGCSRRRWRRRHPPPGMIDLEGEHRAERAPEEREVGGRVAYVPPRCREEESAVDHWPSPWEPARTGSRSLHAAHSSGLGRGSKKRSSGVWVLGRAQAGHRQSLMFHPPPTLWHPQGARSNISSLLGRGGLARGRRWASDARG